MAPIDPSTGLARQRQRTTNNVRRLAHGALAIAVAAAGLIAVDIASPTPKAAIAAPAGSPGVPFTPPVVYQEDFENGLGDTPVKLTEYTGAQYETYTADQGWLERCNGAIVRWTSIPNGLAGPALNNCYPYEGGANSESDMAYNQIRRLAYALGGPGTELTNHAVSAYTMGNLPAANLVQFETKTQIPLASSTGRFLTFGVDSAAVNCRVSAPLFNFFVKDQVGATTPVGSTLNACQGGQLTQPPSWTSAEGGNEPVYKASITANDSFLFTGASVGIVMRNASGAGAGNDGAFDNIRIVDVTPQLDKSFGPDHIKIGESSTLTFTVTGANTGTAVTGWSFTDDLPTGLLVADSPNIGGTCAATTTATPGSNSIAITNGALAQGQMSCTITVDVTPQGPKGADPSPVTYENCAANIKDAVGIDLPNCAPLTVVSEPKLTIAKTSDAGQNARVGQTVKYEVKVKNTGTGDFTPQHEAWLTDDLSDVLDDATYNNDAAVSFDQGTTGAAPTVADGKLNWLGSLKVGETATFTYSVTLTNTGNGKVLNTACIPKPDAAEDQNCATTTTNLPKLTIAKSSDIVELPKNGGTVTYEVTVANHGPGDTTEENPAIVTDDLSDVLDDGSFVDSSLTSSSGLATRDGNTLNWKGPLAVGASAKISYRVTYSANKGGSHELINVACLPEELAQDPNDKCSTVKLPGAALQQWKTSDPKPGIVAAGDDITYTLHFKNIGKAAADVANSDDLTDVLDDADLIAGPTSSNAALTASLDAKKISIAGKVAAGAEYTVSYTVKVRDEAKRGDSVLINALAECEASDSKLCDPIKHEVPMLDVVKSSDPVSGSEVVAGQRVKYTLTFTNLQRSPKSSPAKVDYTDHMKDVLDDATLTAGPTASNAGLQAVAAGDTIRITGEMAYGQKYTVSYTVAVKDYAAQGNHHLGNVVAKAGDKPVCVPNSKLCTEHDVKPPSKLAITGGGVPMPVIWSGLGLFGAGAIVLLIAFRRRQRLSTQPATDSTDTM